MAYRLYLDGVLFPVTPDKIMVKINGNNEKVTLINKGEANILKSEGLTDVEFSVSLPNFYYPYTVYPDGFRPAKNYLDQPEVLKNSKKPFQYIITRTVSANAPSGGSYTVVKGDSLWKIASRYYGSGSKWQTIYNANQSVVGGNLFGTGADNPCGIGYLL